VPSTSAKVKDCGVDLVENVSFRRRTNARPTETLMTKFKQEGISDVILVTDPIDPIYLTSAATKQITSPMDRYGSALTDQTHFGRLYDQTQWRHAFGLSLLADRVPKPRARVPDLRLAYAALPAANTARTTIFPFSGCSRRVAARRPNLTPYTVPVRQPRTRQDAQRAARREPAVAAASGKTYPACSVPDSRPTTSTASPPGVSWGSRLCRGHTTSPTTAR